MRISKILLALVPALIICANSYSQKIEASLQKLSADLPIEKLFIHYDKDYYVAGETVWFKAYFAHEGLPSGISPEFYLQLSDGKGQVIASKKYPILGATAKGNIDLPDSLAGGNYYIQATTAAMLNHGPDFMYQKKLSVYSPVTKPGVAANPGLQIRFYPESGNLVGGIITVVAFKATDNLGNPIEVSGTIKMDDGTAITSFKTFHDGIGKTQFKVQAGKKYSAEVEYNGLMNTYPLPEVMASGINLKIQDEPGGKLFMIARSEKDKQLYDVVTIIAQINNKIVYETEVTFENYPSVRGHLVTDSLPSGILHFTVFNKDGLPLAERISFVNNGEYLTEAGISNAATKFAAKAENNFDISFPAAIQRSLSISVTDGSADDHANRESISSRFLLSSDLKGTIYNPAFYFEKQNDSTAQALDNLMLIHGWSRFEWKKILGDEFPVAKFNKGRLLRVSGIVRDEDNVVVRGGKLNITLESEDSTSQNFEIPVAEDGRFGMDSISFNGESKFFYLYSASNGKQKKATVVVDSAGMDELARHFKILDLTEPAPAMQTTNARLQYQWLKENGVKIKELENVMVRSESTRKPGELVNDQYSTGVFKSMGKVNLDNITKPAPDKSQNVLDYIKNRIQQVELAGNRFVSRKNFSLGSGEKWAVGVFLDEIPTDAGQLRTMRVDQIALVKYFEPGFVGVGSGSPGGAIAVYSKKKENTTKSPDNLDFFTANGYSITREFFQPDYSVLTNEQLPDRRTTLYWNPDVILDSETKVFNVKFFNNDKAKKFKVVMQGFDVEGKMVYLEKVIN